MSVGHETVEVTEEAEQAWVDEIVMLAGVGGPATAFLEDCTPGYYNREGNISSRAAQNSPYIPGINAFNALLETWRNKGELEGMKLG